MRFQYFTLAAAACLMMCAQSSAQSAVSQKAHAPHHAGYVKPGAAVSLTHDYDGQTGVGEFETFTAMLAHIYADGSLSVSLLAPNELFVSAFTPIQNMPIYSGSTLDLPIQFSSAVSGNFTLSFEAVYDSAGGHQSRRILSIPVTIGSQTSEKTNFAGKANIETKSKSGLIALPAIEVIE